MKVTTKPWENTIVAYGTIHAIEGVNITSDVPQKIHAIHFTSGQYVQKGDLLITLDNKDLQATVSSDQAKIKLSQLHLKQMKYLYEKFQAVSKFAYEAAIVNQENAFAKLQLDNAQLKKTIIRAPFSGYVGLRKINLGQYISPGETIVSLQKTSSVYIDFNVPQDDIEAIAVGDKVTTTQSQNSSIVFSGKITALNSRLNAADRTLMVRASIDNQNHILKPDMYAAVTIFLGHPLTSITIPEMALVYNPSSEGVYVINKENRVILTPVTVGQRLNGMVQITSGLAAGQWIVVSGQNKLYSGAKIITSS